MSITVKIKMDDKTLKYETDADGLYQFGLSDRTIKLDDKIYIMLITKDMIIINTEDRDFRNGAKLAECIKDERRINNIDAYDWNGKHLWNIGEIIGDIKMALDGCWITNGKELVADGKLKSYNGSDIDLLACYALGFLYIVDPINRRLIERVSGKIK